MGERVLITGGAGFVGSHMADALARAGHDLTLFDNLEPQVHGDAAGRPAYLDAAHRLVIGDIRDPAALTPLVREADVVFHLAAMVGVGQSMYQVRRYTDVNAMGMATPSPRDCHTLPRHCHATATPLPRDHHAIAARLRLHCRAIAAHERGQEGDQRISAHKYKRK